MKVKAKKRFYCPILKRHVERGETIDVVDKHIEGYLPYVEIVEIVEKVEKAVKKEPAKKTAVKKVK